MLPTGQESKGQMHVLQYLPSQTSTGQKVRQQLPTVHTTSPNEMSQPLKLLLEILVRPRSPRGNVHEVLPSL